MIFKRLLVLVRPFWRGMALAILLGAATIGSSIALLGTSGWLISKAALQPSLAALNIAIVGVRFFGISRGLFRYLERLTAHDVTFRILAGLRVWFYQAVEPLAPARLMEYRSGDLLNRVVADIEALENFFLRVISPPMVALLITIGMAIFMLFYHPLLALVIVLGLATAGLGLPLLTMWLGRSIGEKLVVVRAELNAALVDGVQGMADIVAFGQQEAQAAQIQALNQDLTRYQKQMAYINSLHNGLGSVITVITMLVMLVIAIPALDGLYLAVIALTTLACFEAVLPLPQTFQQLSSNISSARRLFELADAPPPITEPTGTESESTGAAAKHPAIFDVEVSGLTFRYEGNQSPALIDLTFSLAKGKKMAIVGASGAGKSTLINILLRFWDYEEGSVRLGRQELNSYLQDDVHQVMGVVRQDTYLFNATIHENLLLANNKSSDEQIHEAARQAQIHDFIMQLPNGYQTWIGEQGLLLSGGQRQRLAIARALLKDAPILLLDEATANLDANTEREIMKTIHQVSAEKTLLVITHRLVGMEKMDEIIVLRDGRVAERGKHHELMQLEGLYWEMVQQQNEILRVDSVLA